MTPEQTATSSRQSVTYLGSAFTECPKTLRRARELGLTGWAFFVAGLGGALGDTRPDTVAAAIGFIAPEAVRDGWDSARRSRPIEEIASHNLAQCRRWGSEKLDGFAASARLAGLAELAVAAVDPMGMPLFAAWRSASAVPAAYAEDSPGARVAVLMNLLRHHRAGAHLIAVRAAGLTPLQAIVAGREREAGAVAFGWQPPYPAHDPLLRRWMWAESVTDRLAGDAFRDFTPIDRAEFVRLSRDAMEFARRPAGELAQIRVSGPDIARAAQN